MQRLNTNMTTFQENTLINYISRCKWSWAKSMPNSPHEYIVRGNCALTDNEFVEFVNLQREYGVHEHWGNYNLQYLYIDGYKYWTMGNPIPETTVINREKLFGEYDQIADRYDSFALTDNIQYQTQNLQLAEMLKEVNGFVYEIGCGTGRLLQIKSIDPKQYQGIDPSAKMLEIFRQKNPNYKIRVRRKSFEYESDKCLAFDWVISLFGTPSYLMLPYLRKLSRRNGGLFLMFYKHDFVPTYYKEAGVHLHNFNYTEQEIANIFNGSKFFYYDDYFVVTTLNIDFDKVESVRYKEPPKQTTLF